ncbi:hypothetical protein MPSEU_000326800 [Mayamaea pseudoterrestris]|nr:hypothetical protein MPSEU_000326800 [Mayamaea pseudoterrestris]
MPWRGSSIKEPNPVLKRQSSQRSVVAKLQDQLKCCSDVSSQPKVNGDSSSRHYHESINGGESSTCKPQHLMNHSSSMPTSIPELLQHQGGLEGIPQPILKHCLEPVMQALAEMDAMALLHLKEVSHGGPCVGNGKHVHAIHDQVSPPIEDHHHDDNGDASMDPSTPNSDANNDSSDSPVVRYIHLAEIPNQYSMGIFVFPPHAKIPLHDHPGMCVLSRVLYGDLERMSLDLVSDDDDRFVSSSLRNGANSNIIPHYPPGTKRAQQQHIDYLHAPQVTALYPLEGNLHEFRAGPHGAAVLDVLLPPYNHSRDCTFYHAHPVARNQTNAANARHLSDTEEEEDKMDEESETLYYVIVPTGQPEDFHCISGCLNDLGSAR